MLFKLRPYSFLAFRVPPWKSDFYKNFSFEIKHLQYQITVYGKKGFWKKYLFQSTFISEKFNFRSIRLGIRFNNLTRAQALNLIGIHTTQVEAWRWDCSPRAEATELILPLEWNLKLLITPYPKNWIDCRLIFCWWLVKLLIMYHAIYTINSYVCGYA